MKQSINFMTIMDDRVKRSHLGEGRKLHTLSHKDKFIGRKNNRYPYAKAIDFRESKYSQYPKWLTQKEGFTDFMYKSYEKQLMSIPTICEKTHRNHDEKSILDLFLQNVDIFQQVPQLVTDMILDNLQTKYYRAGEVVHEENKVPQFMGVVFIGSVEFKIGKRMACRQRNDVILKDAFIGRSHPTITCKEETIILTLDVQLWHKINSAVREEIEIKERDELNDMMKSKFFNQLHIKDKKAKQFEACLDIECYFKDQIIQEAGSDEKCFYVVYKGDIEEENHIYVREHNKWPMPHRRWEIRAVYNSYHQNKRIRKFDFFGDEEIIEDTRFKAKYRTNQWTILFKMKKQQFYGILNQEDIKRIKKIRAENTDVNYTEFESAVRKKSQSSSDQKKIVLKAISTSLANKAEFSPKRMALIGSYEKSMLRRASVEKTMSF